MVSLMLCIDREDKNGSDFQVILTRATLRFPPKELGYGRSGGKRSPESASIKGRIHG